MSHLWFTNQRIRVALRHNATPLGYSLIECVDIPGGGAPMHTHPPAETFYVVDGEVEVRVWDEAAKTLNKLRLTTGQTAHVAPHVPHGYENIGRAKSQLLAVLTPGKLMEDFFAEGGTPTTDLDNTPPPPSAAELARISEIAARYGILPWAE